MTELVYLNGSLVPKGDARITALDYGFLYGYGLFETMRAYGGRVFRLGCHLERLLESAAMLGIAVEAPVLESAVTGIIRANGLRDARIRLTVSIGEGGAVPNPATCKGPTVLVVGSPLQPLPGHVYERGYRAVVSSITQRNSRSPLSKMKSLNFMESLLARHQAKKAGVDEVILLNERGLLAEASMSNLFIVAGGVLRTPAIECGVLPGITRGAVLEMAEKLGIPAEEGDITLEQLEQADEAFLTNSIIELMPLTVFGGKPVGPGKPGSMTLRLMAAYRELVKQETG